MNGCWPGTMIAGDDDSGGGVNAAFAAGGV